MNASSTALSCLALLAAGLLHSCGGGGSGGGPSGDRLRGELTIPNLGLAAGDHSEGGGTNDTAADAEDCGVLKPGAPHSLTGRVAPGTDPQDVLRVRLAGPTQVTLEFAPDHPAACHLFDIDSGRELLRLESGQRRILDLAAGSFDLVVAAGERATGYRVSLQGTPLLGAVRPTATMGTATRSETQARYLGADQPMRPGEVVVFRDRSAPAALALGGWIRTDGGRGPVEVYTMVGPQRPQTLAAGAAAAASLELETALTARQVAAMPGVRASSPNYTYHTTAEPNDPHYPLQWHYDQIRMKLAWDETQGSAGVIVGVLDTGVFLAHPDLAGRLIGGFDFVSDPSSGLDGDGRDSNPDDPGSGGGTVPSSFHGTHVAGTIGANSNNSIGVAGVDWNCKLMPLRALGKGGSGTLTDIANGILFAAGLANASGTLPPQRADVVNMSLGGPGASTVLESACADASSAGVLLIAAAGNDNASTANYPASFPTVLSVGATSFDRGRAPYSNFASNIDIWAPGGNSAVNENGDQYPDGVLSTMADGYQNSRTPVFSFLQGTSMACPHVAGVAALVLAVRGPTTLGELRAILQTNSQPGKSLPNGGLLMDAHAAVKAAKGGGTTGLLVVATPNAITLQPGTTTAGISLANRGTGNLTLVGPKSGIAYTTGTGWVTSATPHTPGANIDVSKVDVVIDRTGLADGDYEATLVLVFTDGSTEVTTRVPLVLRVGDKTQAGETLFILAVDLITLETLYQTSTNATANYRFDVSGVAAGEYLLVAGTDRNNDDVIGDPGELFGVWPNTDTPSILITDGTGQTLDSLNFSLEEIVEFGTRRRQQYRLLRSAPGH